jgi:hypothetical protein
VGIEVGAIGRYGPVQLESSEFLDICRPVVFVSSGGVGLVCGVRRGILPLEESELMTVRVGDLLDIIERYRTIQVVTKLR